MLQLHGNLVTPGGVAAGYLRFERDLQEIELSARPAPNGPYILPGFIDTHVHGGGGGDVVDGAEGVRTLAAFHVERGTTTLYPTTLTQPWNVVLRMLAGVKTVRAAGEPGLPDVPGAHLEGPFISPERLGAQPPFAVEPSPERVAEVLALNTVRLVTLAPEVPGAVAAARQFAAAGVRVSVGHTRSTAQEVQTVLNAVAEVGGTAGFTHLYNAMSGLSGRDPGALGGALATRDAYAELILDGHHVHAHAFLAALAAKPRHLHLVTDAVRACGLAEGETELGGQRVTVRQGAARLADGTLAGSVLTLDAALRNALGLGVPLARVSELLAAVPARYMGLSDRGAFEPGRRADIVVMNRDFAVQEVYLAGRRVVG